MPGDSAQNDANVLPDFVKADRLAALETNERLRIHGKGGRILLSKGVADLGSAWAARLVDAVGSFSEFTDLNDPRGTHDCSGLEMDGRQFLWSIDTVEVHEGVMYGGVLGNDVVVYSADDPELPSDPALPGLTVRAMTIMLAEEY